MYHHGNLHALQLSFIHHMSGRRNDAALCSILYLTCSRRITYTCLLVSLLHQWILQAIYMEPLCHATICLSRGIILSRTNGVVDLFNYFCGFAFWTTSGLCVCLYFPSLLSLVISRPSLSSKLVMLSNTNNSVICCFLPSFKQSIDTFQKSHFLLLDSVSKCYNIK